MCVCVYIWLLVFNVTVFVRYVRLWTLLSYVDILIQTGWLPCCICDSYWYIECKQIVTPFLCFREFVEEANKASMRINEYLHVRWPAFYLEFEFIWCSLTNEKPGFWIEHWPRWFFCFGGIKHWSLIELALYSFREFYFILFYCTFPNAHAITDHHFFFLLFAGVQYLNTNHNLYKAVIKAEQRSFAHQRSS